MSTYAETSRSLTFEKGRKNVVNGLIAVAAMFGTTGIGVWIASLFNVVFTGWVSAIVFIVLMIGLIFLIQANANNALGLPLLLLFGGLQGIFMGAYLTMFPLSSIFLAIGGTIAITFACMRYAATFKVDTSNWGGPLLIILLIAIGVMFANIWIGSALLSTALSVGIVVLFSAFILYDTQQALKNPDMSYIEFAIDMYLNMLNIFIHLLSLIGND